MKKCYMCPDQRVPGQAYCRPCKNKKSREDYTKRREHHRNRKKAYDASPEKRERSKKWREANPTYAKEYWHKNLEASRERKKKAENKRRALLRGSIGEYTVTEWKKLCKYYGNMCISCYSTKKVTVDHVVPLSRGGANTIDNLQPLCKPCNSSKGTKLLDYRFWFMVA